MRGWLRRWYRWAFNPEPYLNSRWRFDHGIAHVVSLGFGPPGITGDWHTLRSRSWGFSTTRYVQLSTPDGTYWVSASELRTHADPLRPMLTDRAELGRGQDA